MLKLASYYPPTDYHQYHQYDRFMSYPPTASQLYYNSRRGGGFGGGRTSAADLLSRRQLQIQQQQPQSFYLDYDGGGGGTSRDSNNGHLALTGYDDSGNSEMVGGYSSSYDDCCPLVVDPLTLTGFIAGIAAATGFLYILVTMNIAGRKRRELTMNNVFLDLVNKGERNLGKLYSTTLHEIGSCTCTTRESESDFEWEWEPLGAKITLFLIAYSSRLQHLYPLLILLEGGKVGAVFLLSLASLSSYTRSATSDDI